MVVCYLGDGDLTGAASYLAAVMTHFEIAFEHFPSGEPLEPAFADRPYALYVISDYPAANFQPAQMAHLVDCVRGGSGLLMIGGWESFFGRLGEYQGSPLAKVLPVVMQTRDDRRNCPQSCLVWQAADHPLLAGLPWDRPPSIGGFNAIAAKPDAATLLVAREFERPPGRRCAGVYPPGRVAAVGRRPIRPRSNGRAGNQRRAALGRRTGRLGRSQDSPASGRRGDQGRQLVRPVLPKSTRLDRPAGRRDAVTRGRGDAEMERRGDGERGRRGEEERRRHVDTATRDFSSSPFLLFSPSPLLLFSSPRPSFRLTTNLPPHHEEPRRCSAAMRSWAKAAARPASSTPASAASSSPA